MDFIPQLICATSSDGVNSADDVDGADYVDGADDADDADGGDGGDIQCRGVLCKSRRTSAPPIHHKAVTNKPSHTPHFCSAQIYFVHVSR